MARAGMRRWLAGGIAVAALVAVGGCAKDDPNVAVTDVVPLPKGIAQCNNVYKDGAPVDPKTFGDACAQGEDLIVPRPVKLHCSNNKYLYWNQFAWGYEKEQMELLEKDALTSADNPAFAESLKCLKTTAEAAQKTSS
jgi:hypothetical protein